MTEMSPLTFGLLFLAGFAGGFSGASTSCNRLPNHLGMALRNREQGSRCTARLAGPAFPFPHRGDRDTEEPSEINLREIQVMADFCSFGLRLPSTRLFAAIRFRIDHNAADAPVGQTGDLPDSGGSKFSMFNRS